VAVKQWALQTVTGIPGADQYCRYRNLTYLAAVQHQVKQICLQKMGVLQKFGFCRLKSLLFSWDPSQCQGCPTI